MKKIALIGIDWQNDFMDDGSLPVTGATADAKRLAKLIDRLGSKLTNIYFSLDSHQMVQIFNPVFWLNRDNQHPNPFTLISVSDVENGTYRTTKKQFQDWGLFYVKELERKGKYNLLLWPTHCILYTKGWLIQEDISKSLQKWETDYFRRVNFIVKGNSVKSEHYSALKAEVEIPEDPSTQLNTEIIKSFMEHDELVWSGEALSHCLKFSFLDTVEAFNDPDLIKKMVLLTDATSSVPGFEQQGQDFVSEMKSKGLRVSTTVDYLA